MTKPVTGVAMLMLYEEGKWRLDDPVSRFIPEFGKLTVWVGENPDGTPKTEPARRSMTMRELMTHSAGLAYGLVGSHAVDKLYLKAGVLNPRQPLQALIDGRRVAAGRAAGHPLVLQRRGGRAGLPGRKAVGAVRSPTSCAPGCSSR